MFIVLLQIKVSAMKKISFIIPVYNAENFIERCLTNLLKYEGEDVEFIIINDGSTDSSDKIIEKYAKKDDRIIYINKENTGVSNSRNIGIKKASGEYIIFIDIDDYLEENSINKLIDLLNTNYADLYIMPYYLKKSENEEKIDYSIFYNKIYDTKENISKLILNFISYVDEEGNRIQNLMGSIWSKVFRLDIIKKYNIFMNENIEITEDTNFLIEYMAHCKNIKVIDYYFYHYTIENSKSLTTKYKEGLYEELEISLNNIVKILNKQNINFKNAILYRRFFNIHFSIINECKNNIGFKEKRNNILKILKRIQNNKLEVKGLSKKEKTIKFFIERKCLIPLLILYYNLKV